MNKPFFVKLFVKGYISWYRRLVPIIKFFFRGSSLVDMEVKELKGTNLLFTALCMLLGKEDVDYWHYEDDKDWWKLRLYTRRN